ncbi:MAG: phenylalanine--tRNA ligase subunit alpha [Propionibacteriaceae bacterium]
MSGPNDNYDPVEVAALSADSLNAAVAEAQQAFLAATTVAELKAARLAHLGDKSPLALANREIGALPPQARKDAGQRFGQARAAINTAFTEREEHVAAEELARTLVAEAIDVTEPVSVAEGARHPLAALMDTVADFFVGMGYQVADGPEIEAEWMIFDALNMGSDHPTRSTRDTLFAEPVEQHKLMRTETSNIQIRTMLTQEPPIAMVCPGRVYRSDEIDATHLPVFTQLEGLVIDKGITFAHLRGTLDAFARYMFGTDQKTRLRPHYFPFTEPSAEMDLACYVCHGASVGDSQNPCRTCKSTGWIEWGGCGIVNPKVLENCGIDPTVYSGFAFGMGLERTLMLRNNVADIRDVIEGDVRFSRALIGGAR